MKRMRSIPRTILLCLCFSLPCMRCAFDPLAGGGTIETTNGYVAGAIVHQSGAHAPDARVMLLPAAYNPVADPPVPDSRTDTTDAGGLFRFSNVPPGDYNIQTFHSGLQTRLLVTDIAVGTGTTIVPADTLKAPGADVPGTVADFPVLIRLNRSNFDFDDAKNSGEDLRFTGSDGSPLPFEIERWDAAAGRAEVWVKVDTIFGNNATQQITMHWGNASAAAASNSEAVFDTSALSAWVYADSIDFLHHIIATKGRLQYILKLMSIYWEFVECKSNQGSQITHGSAKEKEWCHIAGVRNGTSQYLLVNGTHADSSISLYSHSYAADHSLNFSIGSYLKLLPGVDDQGYAGFKGKIDEVRVSSVPRSADWIRLSYMNQKANDALVAFGTLVRHLQISKESNAKRNDYDDYSDRSARRTGNVLLRF